MTNYYQKGLMDYINLVATEKNISKLEVAKNISIKDFGIVRDSFFGVFKAEKNFKKMSEQYDSVINVKRSFNPGSLAYTISGTGVKLNNLNNLK